MNAKERFKETRKAVLRLNEVKALIMNNGDDWKPQQARAKSGISDPTANRAIYTVDTLGDLLDALRAEETELETFIGESLKIIHAVNVGFGEIYAKLLDARYIDGLSWSDVHDSYGIAKSTGYYLLDIAFDWIDSIGVSKLLSGRYEL